MIGKVGAGGEDRWQKIKMKEKTGLHGGTSASCCMLGFGRVAADG